MSEMAEYSDRIAKASVRICFGEWERVDGANFRPVALGAFGFGGDGAGNGGGGSYAVPLGAYVTENGRTRFRPNPVALFVAAGVGTLLASKGMAGLVRAFRGR